MIGRYAQAMPRFSSTLATSLAAGVLLAGCTVGPDYRALAPAALKVPPAFRNDPVVAAMAPAARPVELATWWRGFDDPVLTWLVERGLAANLDIDAAGARLRQARAQVRSAIGAGLPQLGASGSATRTIGNPSSAFVDPATGAAYSSGGDHTVYRAGFDASFEADLFGGIRRSVEAARADEQSSLAALRDVQATVAAEIALDYVDARLAQRRVRIAQDNLRAQDETLQIVGWRVQAGLVSALDLEQARQLRANTAATIPALDNNYVVAINALAVLLGEAPGAVDTALAAPAPVPLAPPATAIPADVIARRPDVAQAERALAAATARIGVAQAQLYPALRLSGSFSGSDTGIGSLISNGIGSVAAAITAPIFEGGQIRAAIESARGASDAALAGYRSAVLVALRDVENALKALQSSTLRERQVMIAADASNNAVIYARTQYRAGLIDFQTLLDAERSLLGSQDSTATARADRATATVQLYKALGGGWEAAPLPATAGKVTPKLLAAEAMTTSGTTGR